MRHLFLPFFALFAVACCTVQTPEATPLADVPANLSEADEQTQSASLRAGENTYAQTCGPLRTKLDASSPPPALKARMDAGGAFRGAAALPRPLKTNHTPLPAELSGLRISVVCNIVSDLTIDGTPTHIKAFCSDERFKGHAEEAVSNMRWMPFTVGDTATPLPGMITKWEYCTYD